MVSVESYKEMRAPLISLSKILGAEIWTSDKLFQPASYFLMAHMVAYNVCHCYTISKYSSNTIHLMKIVITFGIATQLIFKFFLLGVAKKTEARNVLDLVEECIYQRYTDGTLEEKQIIQKMMRVLRIIFKLLVMLYFSTLFVFCLWPIYVYYTTGELVPLFSYEIPRLSLDTSFGYVVTMVFHMDIYLLGLAGSLLSDFAFIVITLHVLASSDLFELHLHQLKELLTAETPEKPLDAIADKWKCCMQDHQFTTQILEELEDLFNVACLIQVFTCVFTICDAMLLVALTDWYAALCFLAVVFGELSIYFILGNFIELKIDEMYKCITELPWNLLTVSQQKEYYYLLAKSQRPMMITIYGFAPLNFESYMTILKMLYQFFVMIMQYME